MKLVVQFYADVNEKSTNDLLNWVNEEIFNARKANDTIEGLFIQIASYGGSADRGILVYNTLRHLGIPITTIGMSNVDSAAISIFCAGNKRFAMRSCRFLIHEASIPIATNLDTANLHEMSEVNQIINTESARIVAKTCAHKSAKMQSIRQLMRQSIVWNATIAKKKRLIQDFADTKVFFDVNADQIKMYFISNPQEGLSSQQTKK